jgi:hypothetical protein
MEAPDRGRRNCRFVALQDTIDTRANAIDHCKVRHNMSDAKLRSYATVSAITPRSPTSIWVTPVSPICGASRQNRSSLGHDRRSIGPRRKKAISDRLIEVRRYYANFSDQAQSRKIPRPLVAKVEWHPGELYPRVGLIVTNLSRSAERVIGSYDQRGTAEQWSQEGKNVE